MRQIKLEQYYSGNESWVSFATLCKQEWTDSALEQSLVARMNNDIDLAKVIFHHFRENSLEWIGRKVPALDGLTPIECLKSESKTNRLKECLMRMY